MRPCWNEFAGAALICEALQWHSKDPVERFILSNIEQKWCEIEAHRGSMWLVVEQKFERRHFLSAAVKLEGI